MPAFKTQLGPAKIQLAGGLRLGLGRAADARRRSAGSRGARTRRSDPSVASLAPGDPRAAANPLPSHLQEANCRERTRAARHSRDREVRRRRDLALRDPQEDLPARGHRGLRAAGAGRWCSLTQLIFYGLPWLTWNGRQAVLFDLGARKFYIFGLVFWPQDVIYLTVILRALPRSRCSCSPRSPGGCGAATPARRPSTPRSSSGSSAGSKATAWRG